MIRAIETYLVTNGNGLEAVDFYKEALKAEVTSCMLWKDRIPNCPPEHANLLMNAQLNINGIRLMISDENPNETYKAGFNITACIVCDSVETAKEVYDKLSVDAQNIHLELQETFWSPAYANLVDKYGMMWQITTEL